MSTIGDNIRTARKSLKMSQDDLAAAIGANRVTISKYENGITVAPKNWFLDRPAPDIYLDGWVVL